MGLTVGGTNSWGQPERFVAVNDLGLPGQTWTLSPFTVAGGKLFQRTSKEIICIGQ